MIGNESIDFNKWADYWYYTIGVNIVPVVSKYKTGKKGIEWKPWQFKSIPEDLFAKWKSENLFADGIGVMTGEVWRGENKGKLGKKIYLVFIDCDNSKAIKEFSTRNGRTKSLQEISEKFLVEQHPDNPNKCHIYFYSEIPFPKKSSDVLEKAAASQNKEQVPIPLYEIKCRGSHGIAFATPSMHQDGHRYQIIGTSDPVLMGERGAEDIIHHIDGICKRYNISYLDNVDASGNVSKVPIESLYSEDFEIHKGNNRHEALMRFMESIIRKNALTMRLPAHIIRDICYSWNQKQCVPPLDDKEFEKQWIAANEFMVKKLAEQDMIEDVPRTEQQEEQQQQTEQEYEKMAREFMDSDHKSENIISLQNLGLDYAGKPVCTSGTVIGISGLVPDWSMIKFECKSCGAKNRADIYDETKAPKRCRQCDKDDGFIEQLDLSITPRINQQTILIQDKSESMSCILSGIQNDMWPVKPGQKIQALGIQKYKSIYNRKMNQREWTKYFKLLAVKPIEGIDVSYTEQDVEYFKQITEMPDFIEKILLPSFAPHIRGNMDELKLVCIYTLASQGLERPFNSLLLGPPAKGKTQLLEYCADLSHYGNLTTFVNTSIAGLTTETRTDPMTGSKIAVPGILGVYSLACFTDINGVMHHSDGKKLMLALNDALERKIATSGKAGGAQNFDARCAVLGDSNNHAASWDYEMRVAYNLQFAPKSFLSRWDLLAIVPKDATNEQHREVGKANYRAYRQKQNPIKLHEGDWTDPETGAPRLGFQSLRKYFYYVSQQALPELPDDSEAEELFADNYVGVMKRDIEYLIDGRYNRTALILARVRARLLFRQITPKEELFNYAIPFVNKCKNIETVDPKTGEKDGNYLAGGYSKEELSQEELNKMQQWVAGCKIAMDEAKDWDGYFTKTQLMRALSIMDKPKWMDDITVAQSIDDAVEAGKMMENNGRYKWIG